MEQPISAADLERKGTSPGLDEPDHSSLHKNDSTETLTPQQRKMILVAEALEETGMGKYQWYM
jgi:hypothetical protein